MEEFRNTDKSYGTLLKMYGPWVAAHFWNPHIMEDLLSVISRNFFHLCVRNSRKTRKITVFG